MKFRKRYAVFLGLGFALAWWLRGKSKFEIAGQVFVELPVKFSKLSNQVKALETSGNALSKQLETVSDREENREVLAHIITLERWGTQRLRVLLGEAFVRDTSSDHAPPADLSWEDLRQLFADTRHELLEVAQGLGQRAKGFQVEHNQFGPLSGAGWLRYLNTHAFLESKRFKR
jgi:hypothetical protein